MRYCYIHGFNSGPKTSTLDALKSALGVEVFGLSYKSQFTYYQNIEKLSKQIIDLREPCILIGTSLGGFYASRLLINYTVAGAVMFNPCNFPAEELQQFIGLNTNFSTGEQYELTDCVVDTYSMATEFDLRFVMKPKLVYLANNDELINNTKSESYWNDYAHIEWFEGNHRVTDFSPFKDEILSMENLIYL